MTTIALYTTSQTRQLDRIAIEEFGIPGLVLMERAGRAAFNRITQEYGSSASVLVLCGTGNNGGDGYVVARLLREIGIHVQVIATGEPETADAATVYRRYLDTGSEFRLVSSADLPAADLIVDGLLGSGLTRAPAGPYAELINKANGAGCPVVALDLPSGLSGDTGSAFKPCIRADMTVTFIGRKLGQYTADGPDVCGNLHFEGLALDQEILRLVTPEAQVTQSPSLPGRARNSHKGLFGHVVVVGGEQGMLGAILLAGRAALRSGTGLVTLLGHPTHLDTPALVQPELMSRSFHPDGNDACVGLLSQASAIVFGPGTGMTDWSRQLHRAVMLQDSAQVWDAGALRILAESPDSRENRVLTPHPGEAAVLLGCQTAGIQRDRPGAAREIQRIYGGVCVLKGSGTIIASEDRLEVSDRGNPGMASAGMGDVLSGIIGALLGQGMTAWDAARHGVYWHGAAGDAACDEMGEVSMLATDVIDQLPGVIQP
jgi:NAD(P)H-hydrate epimerase